MHQLRTSFSTLGCPDWSFQQVLENGSRAGYDGVEIRLLERQLDLLAHPALQPSELSTRRRELADSGFRVSGLGSSVNFHSPDTAERARLIEIGKRYLDLAVELGADFVRVFGDVLQPLPGSSVPVHEVSPEQRRTTLRQVVDGLQHLGEYSAQLGVSVIIETHGDFADSKLMVEVMQQITTLGVGVLWDTHHPWRFAGEPLRETMERLRPWIRSTHWKDSVTRPQHQTSQVGASAAHQAINLMSGHRPADYVLFGGGEFPAIECLRLLDSIGYDGWHSLEWEKMWHPEIEDTEIALPLFPKKIRELHRVVVESRSCH